ncbi:hypothetical protein nbrc107696_41360 [Gordonia spumicola]|uniref:Uncharacterized protein n=1 Tax=Gordonia spumicola TaxID=589161 RepID=A0A7I9VF95_9ACTN|nr:hypothetical protein nbrc107696_41360 [Gordonia spumicola]
MVVAGAAPPTVTWRFVYGGIVLALWIGAAVCAVMGPTWAAVAVAVIAGIGTVLFAANVWAEHHIVGKPDVTAGPDGLTAGSWTIPWDDVRSCGFVTGPWRYKLLNPQMYETERSDATSLIVTRRTADDNGRQIQVGYTLYEHHTDNLDEFLAAVRRYAPSSDDQFGRSTRDYVVDPAVNGRLVAQWAAEGRLTVTNRRGKEKLLFDGAGIRAGRDTIAWGSVAALGAVTDSHTTKMNGVSTGTTYTHRLVIVSTEVDRKGRNVTLRPEYASDYVPPLEQLVPVLQGILPSLSITDKRRSLG